MTQGEQFHFLATEDLMISDIFAAENLWPYQHRFNIAGRALNQIYVNLSGERSYRLPDGTTFRIHGTAVLFMPQGSSYVTVASSPAGNHGLGVLFALRNAAGERLICGDRPVLLRSEDTGGFYEATLRELLREFLRGGLSILRVKELLYRMLRRIAAEQGEENASPQRRSILPAIAYMESHLQKSISADELAALCFLSRSTFFRRFRREYQTSPEQFHLKLRIAKSSQLLESGLYSVEQAAEIMGFCDTAHFCHTFLRLTGRHPGDTRTRLF